MTQHSRRTVIRTAAWSVPAISIVAAAPAYADVSGTPPECTTSVCLTQIADTSCKLPGQSTDISFGYRFYLTFTSTATTPLDVTILSFTFDGGETITKIQGTNPQKVAPGTATGSTDTTIGPFTIQSTNSANQSATVTYQVGSETATSQSFDISGFKPCPKD